MVIFTVFQVIPFLCLDLISPSKYYNCSFLMKKLLTKPFLFKVEPWKE